MQMTKTQFDVLWNDLYHVLRSQGFNPSSEFIKDKLKPLFDLVYDKGYDEGYLTAEEESKAEFYN